MIKFIRYAILFAIPFLIWFLIILVTDPYDYWGISPFEGDKQKLEIAKLEDHGRRLEFISFKQNPRRNIVIGDSQLQHIDFGSSWAQLSTPGSGIEDEIFILKKMAEYAKIDTVMIGINPYEFVRVSSAPLPVTKSAFKIIDSPYYYFFDRCVYSVTFNFLLKRLKGDTTVDKELPNMNKDEFWKQQLLSGKQHLEKRANRKVREAQLTEIKDICEANQIIPLIVVPMAHTDLYEMYKEYVEGEFLEMLKSHFDVIYDFYVPNDFTSDKENFGDPFHANNDNQYYINAIFHGDSTYCRILLNK